MAKERNNQGGPTHKPKDEPAGESHRNAQSRDELKERSMQGDRPGHGRRNGSDKAPRG